MNDFLARLRALNETWIGTPKTNEWADTNQDPDPDHDSGFEEEAIDELLTIIERLVRDRDEAYQAQLTTARECDELKAELERLGKQWQGP